MRSTTVGAGQAGCLDTSPERGGHGDPRMHYLRSSFAVTPTSTSNWKSITTLVGRICLSSRCDELHRTIALSQFSQSADGFACLLPLDRTTKRLSWSLGIKPTSRRHPYQASGPTCSGSGICRNGAADLAGPLQLAGFRQELGLYFSWYNGQRPHAWLGGATPDEVYHGRRWASRMPRFEPRPRWPRRSRCALPQTLVRGHPGTGLELVVTCQADRCHLPIVTLRRAA